MAKNPLSALTEQLSETLAEKKRRPARVLDLDAYGDEDEQAAPPNPTSRPVTPPDPTRPVAPERNYNKRANSLDKLALPAGIFRGSSKQLYDALYVRTRGAVVPCRTIRATKRELSEWSGVRNVKTIDSHLRYFAAVGLVVSDWQPGQNDGALYEVLLPEETQGLFVARSRGVTPPDATSPHLTPPDVETRQKMETPPDQISGSPHQTQVVKDQGDAADPKTSIKTKDRSDDEPAAFAELFALAEQLTGRPARPEQWRELAEVLATELRIAAGRTTVSSVPAFLAEHLRRRLFKDKAKLIAGAENALQGQGTQKATVSDCPDCGGNGYYFDDPADSATFHLCRHPKLREGASGRL